MDVGIEDAFPHVNRLGALTDLSGGRECGFMTCLIGPIVHIGNIHTHRPVYVDRH